MWAELYIYIFQLFWPEKTDDCQVLQECQKIEEFYSQLEQNSDFNYENSKSQLRQSRILEKFDGQLLFRSEFRW